MKRNRQRKSREVEAKSLRNIAPLSFPKWTPKRVVGVVATCVVLLLLYGGDIQRALTGNYNPRISFERGARASGGGAPRRAGEPTTQGSVFDGEVYRTEGRLREASAVAIAASLSGVARWSVERRPLRTVDELLEEIVRRGLLPPGVELVRERNLLVSERSTIHVRFRPEPFGIEIVSLGRERADGPGLLLRVPDDNAPPQNTRQRYFYSFRLENVSVPKAFAPSSAVQAAGWQIDYITAQLLEGANAEHLSAWTRSQPQSQNR
jgi:hypothetical protein